IVHGQNAASEMEIYTQLRGTVTKLCKVVAFKGYPTWDMLFNLGSRVLTVNDKIRVHVHTRTRAQYESFLPGGINYAMLSDLALGYVSPAVQVEVAPSLPRHALSGAILNGQAALGRTGWISPDTDSNPDQQVSDAVFAALDQRTRHRNHRAAA
ncbi:MAG: type VI secretion system baseplate subunit TssG, partial [Pseudomonadota bacterium]